MSVRLCAGVVPHASSCYLLYLHTALGKNSCYDLLVRAPARLSDVCCGIVYLVTIIIGAFFFKFDLFPFFRVNHFHFGSIFQTLVIFPLFFCKNSSILTGVHEI